MGVKKVGSRVLVLILYVFSLVLLSNIVFGACPGVLGVDYTEYQCNGYNQQCPSCRSCERKDEFTVNTIQYVPDCSVCGYPGQNFLEDTYIDNCDSYDLLKRYKPGEPMP